MKKLIITLMALADLVSGIADTSAGDDNAQTGDRKAVR